MIVHQYIAMINILIYTKISLAKHETTQSQQTQMEHSLIVYRPIEQKRITRGIQDHEHYYEMPDDHLHHHEEMTTMMPAEQKEARKTDSWGSQYYDFLINEGSYKFWAVFQIITAAILIYSAFAAIYYAKFNLVTADYYDYYDARSFDSSPSTTLPWLGLNSQTFQNILNAVSSNKFS